MAEDLNKMLDSLLEPEKKLDFICEIPCPVKLAARELLMPFLRDYGASYRSYLPTTCGLTETEPGREILKTLYAPGTAQFREAVLSFGFRDFFERPMIEKYINRTYCRTEQNFPISAPFAGLDIQDPEGVFSVFSSLPMVLIADKRHLGGLPLPKTWEDLLSPVYRGAISLSGGKNDPEEMPLMYIHKNFGEDGLKQLAANTCQCLAGSRVAQVVGSNHPDTAPLYLCTRFFANASLRQEDAQLIVPADGAFVNPVYLITRRELSEPLERLSRFLLSPAFLQVWEDNFYPTTSADVQPKLAADTPLQWLGWDYVHSHDMIAFGNELRKRFMGYVKKYGSFRWK